MGQGRRRLTRREQALPARMRRSVDRLSQPRPPQPRVEVRELSLSRPQLVGSSSSNPSRRSSVTARTTITGRSSESTALPRVPTRVRLTTPALSAPEPTAPVAKLRSFRHNFLLGVLASGDYQKIVDKFSRVNFREFDVDERFELLKKAASVNNMVVLQALKAAGFFEKALYVQGANFLHVVAYYFDGRSQRRIIETALNGATELLSRVDHTGLPPVFEAIRYKNQHFIELMFDNPRTRNFLAVRSMQGQSALDYAAYCDNQEAFAFLIRKIHWTHDQMMQACQLAVKYGSIRVLTFLRDSMLGLYKDLPGAEVLLNSENKGVIKKCADDFKLQKEEMAVACARLALASTEAVKGKNLDCYVIGCGYRKLMASKIQQASRRHKPLRVRFAVADDHWLVFDVQVTDAGVSIIVLDAITPEYPHYATNMLKELRTYFPRATVYWPAYKRQYSMSDCYLFALDDLRHLEKVENYLPGLAVGENLHDYFKKDPGPQTVMPEETILGYTCYRPRLPLHLARTGHVLANPARGVDPFIEKATEEERLLGVNKRDITPSESVAEHRLMAPGGRDLNFRLQYKADKMLERLVSWLATTSDDDAAKAALEKSISGFEKKYLTGSAQQRSLGPLLPARRI